MGSGVLQIYDFSIILITLLGVWFLFLLPCHLIYLFFNSSGCSLDFHRLSSSVGVERVDFLIALHCSITYSNNYRSKSVIKWEVLTHIL